MKNYVDYVLDLETSGKRGWHGIRDKFNPPKITQVGLIRIDQSDPKKFKAIIGKGPGSGWTNELAALVEKYQIQSEMKIPAAFWQELAADAYDPSVTRKGSFLNNQVRDHVREYIALRTTGKTGDMRSAMSYIRQFQKQVTMDIENGINIRLHTYNKGFDISQMRTAAYGAGEEGRGFLTWLDKHISSGKIELKGIEENIHRGMFDVMMQDTGITPRFASSSYFTAAHKAGFKTVGMEATTPHYALREMMTDLSRIKSGESPSQVLKGLPKSIQAGLSKVGTYEEWMKFKEGLVGDAGDVLMGHYKKKAVARHGPGLGKHVRHMGFEFVSGWGADSLSEILGEKPVAHRGYQDAVAEWNLHRRLSDKRQAQNIARQIMGDEATILRDINRRYTALGQEFPQTGRPMSALMKIAKGKKAPPRGLTRLARSPFTLPIMAVVGGVALADQLSKQSAPRKKIKAIREQMKGKIEGLRKAVGQWDLNQGGINTTNMGNNVSAFGSGRWDSVWSGGTYKGTQIDPSIYYQRLSLNMRPDIQYEAAQERMRGKADYPTGYSPSKEELSSRMIDLSDYIYELKDADSILLRRAWLNQNIPLVGPLLGAIQKSIMNMSKTLTGKDHGFEVRVSGLDAPEVAHPDYGEDWLAGAQPHSTEATNKMRSLMKGSPLQQIFGGRATHIKLMPGKTYGRWVGVPYASEKDIGQELVAAGGAIALSSGGDTSPYFATEQMAANTGQGMWQYPGYQGILEARRRRIKPMMSHLQKRTQLAGSLEAAATASLVTYANNPIQHGVRDQHSQNLFVRGF